MTKQDVQAALDLEQKMFKLRKKVEPSIIEELEQLDTEGLKARLVRCDMNMHETIKNRDANEKLRELIEQAKEAKAPYAEALKAQKNIAAYCACLFDKGGESSDGDDEEVAS